MTTKTKHLLWAATGPAATFLLMSGGDFSDCKELWYSVRLVSTATFISVLSTIVVHRISSTGSRYVLKAVLASEALYICTLLVVVEMTADPLERSESLMWLPIAVPYMVVIALPMTYTVCVGITKFIQESASRNQ
jgi:uncharacterized SAM-binding protein YcdF (DUF218 family)